MVRIAVLSEQVSAQLRAAAVDRPRELDNVEVVWSGTSSEELRRRGKSLRPQVLVAEMGLLGSRGEVRKDLEDLLLATEAELALILYSFTRRDTVSQLSSTRSRAIKSPMSLATLRLNMLSLLVKDALHAGAEAGAAPESRGAGASQQLRPVAPNPEVSVPEPQKNRGALPTADSSDAALKPGMPRMFTQAQLGRLQELKSTVRCECPSHVSELVTSLAAFEEYSRTCQNTDAEDAKLHAHLFEQTSRARRLMEQALLALCQYERIEL